ncbi:MCE family protein [Mycolicibacterium fluoranthenivorans]|nr:MCE family protein [Mycolicibacterium fluoranthenivorans]
MRLVTAIALLIGLMGGIIAVWPRSQPLSFTALFPSAIGLYPGDAIKIAGVPVGTITAITPGVTDTVISMSVRHGAAIPADAGAIIIAPNLVSARFIELTPVYDSGPQLTNGAVIPATRTGVPVEWDEVKDQLAQLSRRLGPAEGAVQGPLAAAVDQAADTFDGSGQSFRQAVRELSQTAGRLGDSRADLLGTVKSLHVLVDALAKTNDQIVEFSGHVASLSKVLADSSTSLDTALGTLGQALADIRDFLHDNNSALTGQIDKLTQFTNLLTEHSEDIEQVLHVAPNGLANFYNIYDPAQAAISGILNMPNFRNPMQFVCGGGFEAAGTPDYFKRAEICKQRMAPVLKRLSMNFPPILFHPINSITAYKGQVIYDTPETQAKAQTPLSQLQWEPLPGVSAPPAAPDADLGTLILPPPPISQPPAPPAPAVTEPTPPPPPPPTGTTPEGQP